MPHLLASRAIGLVVPSALLLAGCGDESTLVPQAGSGGGGGEPAGCEAGELWLEDGTCRPAGVPPGACGEGFVHDGDRGCEPILPPERCPAGLLAVPGETACREIAPCGSGSWGSIPIEANTEHVDQGYPGDDSDGSAARPWISVRDGVAAAAPGAIVAVAAGTYVEDVLVGSKAVRLWGRCPAMVEIVATPQGRAAVDVRAGADGTELHSLALSGPVIGLGLSGSEAVVGSALWIHHNLGRGVVTQPDLGPTSLTLRGSLIEHNGDMGVLAFGTEVVIEATVVRDTQASAPGQWGRGVGLQIDPDSGESVTGELRGSLVEHNRDVGIIVQGSILTVEDSVVRGTETNADGLFGDGLAVQRDVDFGVPSTLAMVGSLIEQNATTGVQLAGSTAVVQSTVVRDTRADTLGQYGRGLLAQAEATWGAPATLLLRASLVERNQEVALLLAGATATVESTVLRDTQPDSSGRFGRGLTAQSYDFTGGLSTLTVRSAIIERQRETGLLLAGAEAVVDDTIIRDTQLGAQVEFSRGIQLQATGAPVTGAALTLRGSLLERNIEVSIAAFGSSISIEGCTIRESVARPDGALGDGVLIGSFEIPGSATITSTRIEHSARAAVTSFGATIAIGSSQLACQLFDLDAEPFFGFAPTFEDRGGNFCGCPQPTGTCRSVSAALEPPAAMAPVN